MSSLAELHGAIDVLALPVHLEPVPKVPRVEGAVEPPADASLWQGPYACVVAWPVSGTDALEMAWTDAQNWLDCFLRELERDGLGAVDGYLVLAVPEEPPPEVRRKIEESPHVCRKHVVWRAEKGEGWNRVSGITALRVSPACSGPAVADRPGLDTEEETLVGRIEDAGVRQTVEHTLAEVEK